MQTSAQSEITVTDDALRPLRRLWGIAHGHSGQCRYVAAFLLGLYNGARFPFDLTNFRALDDEIVRDCFAVLEMDSRPAPAEVHVLLGVPGTHFEKLAEDWRIVDLFNATRKAPKSTGGES